jgi:hypothetical protein
VKPVVYFEYNRENMSQIGEDGLPTLRILHNLGYNWIIFFDNTGRFLTGTSLSNTDLINDLHDYADGRHGQICYYDLCIFHKSDDDIARSFLEQEKQI